jgi:hypothetical protein
LLDANYGLAEEELGLLEEELLVLDPPGDAELP